MEYGVELEFEVVENGRTIPASELIYDVSRRNHIGLDGNPDVGEIRSNVKPSVKLAMKSAIYYLTRFTQDTSSDTKIGFNSSLATGIHIHFGINTATQNVDYRTKYKKVMTYAMRLLLPFYMRWNNPQRLNSHYWYNYSTENKPWGFEFRLIPSAFIKDKYFKFIISFIDHLSLLIYNNINMDEESLKDLVRLHVMEVTLDMLMANQIKSRSGITKDIRDKVKKNKRISLYYNCNCESINELKTVVENSYDKRHLIIVDNSIYDKVRKIRTFLKLYDDTVIFFPGIFILRQSNSIINLVKNKLSENGYDHFIQIYRKVKTKSLRSRTSVIVTNN